MSNRSSLFAVVFLMSGCAPLLTDAYREAAAEQLIVEVTVEGCNSQTPTPPAQGTCQGTGIIYSVDDKSVFVATAAHVLQLNSDCRPTTPSTHVCIWAKTRLSPDYLTARRIFTDDAPPAVDLDVIRFSRAALKDSEPYWRVLVDESTRPKPGSMNYVVGSTHGLNQNAPAMVVLASDRKPTPGEVTAAPASKSKIEFESAIDPGPGDSGGAMLTTDWRLFGLYNGASDAAFGYRIDHVATVLGPNIDPPITPKLSTSRSELAVWPYIAGAAALTLGAAGLLTGYYTRDAYYNNPDGHSKGTSTALTLTGDIALAIGIGLIGYQLFEHFLLAHEVGQLTSQ